jgi:uncharacterized cupin superfamily protein
MIAFTAEGLVKERHFIDGTFKSNRMFWVSEAAGLTQFGVFVEILQPETCSSIKHWHCAEDEMVYVLEGN